jgi:hypothetical protein
VTGESRTRPAARSERSDDARNSRPSNAARFVVVPSPSRPATGHGPSDGPVGERPRGARVVSAMEGGRADATPAPSNDNGHNVDWIGLSRLERLEPSIVWGDQAPDLTPWLLENLDVIGDALGLDITRCSARHASTTWPSTWSARTSTAVP